MASCYVATLCMDCVVLQQCKLTMDVWVVIIVQLLHNVCTCTTFLKQSKNKKF